MGSSPMGGGLMGFDSLTFVVPPPPVPLNRARNWDASIRAYDQQADGSFLGIHPIDQIVQQLITIEQGAIPALGNIGQRYRKRLLGASPQQVPTIVLDETKRVLKQLTTAGDIVLLGATADTSIKGKIAISVSYANQRLTGSLDQRTKTVAALVLV